MHSGDATSVIIFLLTFGYVESLTFLHVICQKFVITISKQFVRFIYKNKSLNVNFKIQIKLQVRKCKYHTLEEGHKQWRFYIGARGAKPRKSRKRKDLAPQIPMVVIIFLLEL